MADPAALPFSLSPDIQKAPVPHNINDCRDKSCYSDSCGATRLDASASTHCIQTYAPFVNEVYSPSRLHASRNLSAVQLALQSPFASYPSYRVSTVRSSLLCRSMKLLALLQRFSKTLSRRPLKVNPFYSF